MRSFKIYTNCWFTDEDLLAKETFQSNLLLQISSAIVSTIVIKYEEVKYKPLSLQSLEAKSNSDHTCTFYSATIPTLPPKASFFIYPIKINAAGYRNTGIDSGIMKTRSLEQNFLRREEPLEGSWIATEKAV